MGWQWKETAQKGDILDQDHPVRRVVAKHEIRFEGFSDLLLYAHGVSVFDIGCNRGHVGWDFAINGAAIVHGCDIDRASIQCARMWFSEHPNVDSKFEVVNLEKGPDAVTAAFGNQTYDIVLLLGVTHKLKRAMSVALLGQLVVHVMTRAKKFFVWTGYKDDVQFIEQHAQSAGLKRAAYSEIALPDRPAIIWRR
jgi:2-polyprenyl-3-methyl-5-hydroxy-6-metoxy-1,4-benzoquinol methylase